MKTFQINLDEKRLAALSGLILAAGSRLGDAGIMMQSADMLQWLQSQIETKEPAPSNVVPMQVGE